MNFQGPEHFYTAELRRSLWEHSDQTDPLTYRSPLDSVHEVASKQITARQPSVHMNRENYQTTRSNEIMLKQYACNPLWKLCHIEKASNTATGYGEFPECFSPNQADDINTTKRRHGKSEKKLKLNETCHVHTEWDKTKCLNLALCMTATFDMLFTLYSENHTEKCSWML